MMSKPIISVVTVCFNAVTSIEETILSVLNQTYHNIEYIIIDGGSTDGTVDIIRRYSPGGREVDKHPHFINRYISEPDCGIYDAMNKGIAAATGDYIAFLNSGDIYFSCNIFERVCSTILKSGCDVLYGDIILKYSFGEYYAKAFPLEEFDQHFPFSHPSSFVKTSIIKQNLFDLKYKIVADYNFFFSMYHRGYSFEYLPEAIAVFEAEEGVSSRNVIGTFKEVSLVNGEFDTNQFRYIIKYILLNSKDFVRTVLSKLVPKYYKKWLIRAIESRNYIAKIDK